MGNEMQQMIDALRRQSTLLKETIAKVERNTDCGKCPQFVGLSSRLKNIWMLVTSAAGSLIMLAIGLYIFFWGYQAKVNDYINHSEGRFGALTTISENTTKTLEECNKRLSDMAAGMKSETDWLKDKIHRNELKINAIETKGGRP